MDDTQEVQQVYLTANDRIALIKSLFGSIDLIHHFVTQAAADENSYLWSHAYDMGFKIMSLDIRPRLNVLGIHFEYYDPDGSEEDDIRALNNALQDLKHKLTSLIKGF